MPTLIQEFDTRQFDQGVLRIRQGLDVVEAEAKKAGGVVDKAFGKATGVDRATQSTGRFSKSLGAVNQSAGLLRSTIGGIVSALTFDRVRAELAGFEASMQRALGVTQATGVEFDQLRALALDLGRQTRFSAQEAADGIVFLGQAGLETADIIELLPVSLNLAAGASTDLARSADVLSNVMSAFRQESAEAADTADILSATLINSNVNFEQLAISLRQVAPIAANTGTSLEDVSAAIGVLGNNAIQGEQAGTALRAIILSLIDPSTDAAKAIESLGLELDDVNPEKVGLIEAFQALSDAQIGTAEASAIFGREAAAAATVLVSQIGQVEGLAEVLAGAEGATSDLADTLNQGLEPATKAASSAFSGLIIALGDAGVTDTLSAGFRNVADSLNLFTDRLQAGESVAGSFFETLGFEATDAIRKLTGGLIDLEGPLEAVDQFFADAADSAVAFVADLLDIRPAFGNVGSAVEQAGDAIADTFTSAIEAARDALDGFFSILPESVRNVLGLGDAADDAADGVQDLGEAAEDAADATEGYNQELERNVELLAQAAVNTSDLAGGAGDYRDAANQAATATSGFSATFGALGLASQQTFDEIVFGAQDVFGTQLPGSVEDFKVFTGDQLEELAGVFDTTLDALGLGLEDLFGRRAAGTIEQFVGFASNNFGKIQGIFGSVADFFGISFGQGAGQATSAVEQFSAVSGKFLGDFGSQAGVAAGQVDGIGGAIQGLGAQIPVLTALSAAVQNGAQGFASIQQQAGTFEAILAGAVNPAILSTEGLLNQFGLSGVAVFEKLNIGVADFASALGGLGGLIGNLGSQIGGLIPGIGGKAGGIIGGLIGGIGGSIGSLGGVLDDIGGLFGFGKKSKDKQTVAAKDIFEEIRKGAIITGEAIRDEFGSKSQEVIRKLNDRFIEFAERIRTTDEPFETLGQTATIIAGTISDQFQISAVDVLTVLQRLGPGVIDTFEDIGANGDEVAKLLSEVFGLSFEEVRSLLAVLRGDAQEQLGQIDDAAKFAALGLSTAFGGSAQEVLEVLQSLAPGTIDSFNDILNNADVIARNLAVLFGVNADEIKAILLQLAEDAGLSLSGIGVSGQTVAADLLEAFRGFDQNLGTILAEVEAESSGAFENIRQNADGSFELINEGAQARLEELVLRFGGTQGDIQRILEILANNADISLSDILRSGVFAFEGIGNAAEETLRKVLADVGLSEQRIDEILSRLVPRSKDIFDQVSNNANGAFDNITAGFGASEADIRAGLDRLRAGGGQVFATLQSTGRSAADQISASFRNALGGVSGSFFSLTASAQSSFGSAVSSAQSAAARIRSAFANLPSASSGRLLATGGVITGPVTLSSSSPLGGSAFARGGVLGGLTGISQGNVAGPFSAMAGENGPEAILPLTQTSDGLGVTAKGMGGGSVVKIYFIEGVDRAETDKIKTRLLQLDASIDFRAGLAAEDLLLGAA